MIATETGVHTGNGLDGQTTGALQINAQLFLPSPYLRVKQHRHPAHARRGRACARHEQLGGHASDLAERPSPHHSLPRWLLAAMLSIQPPARSGSRVSVFTNTPKHARGSPRAHSRRTRRAHKRWLRGPRGPSTPSRPRSPRWMAQAPTWCFLAPPLALLHHRQR